jgi:hypothetical protein
VATARARRTRSTPIAIAIRRPTIRPGGDHVGPGGWLRRIDPARKSEAAGQARQAPLIGQENDGHAGHFPRSIAVDLRQGGPSRCLDSGQRRLSHQGSGARRQPGRPPRRKSLRSTPERLGCGKQPYEYERGSQAQEQSEDKTGGQRSGFQAPNGRAECRRADCRQNRSSDDEEAEAIAGPAAGHAI